MGGENGSDREGEAERGSEGLGEVWRGMGGVKPFSQQEKYKVGIGNNREYHVQV